MVLQPLGSRLLISQIEDGFTKSDGGIEVQSDLDKGIVVAVSADFSHIYKPDDIILYSKGAGQAQPYNGKICLWIDGRSVNNSGDVVAIITEEKEVD